MAETPTPFELELEGDLSVAGAAGVLQQMQSAFSRGTDIQVRFGKISMADLSCIQLLISANRTAHDQGLNFSITGEVPEELERIARESATEHLMNELLLN